MQKKVEEFEIKMRCQSVGTLCFMALMWIIMTADHNQRQNVSITKWFGLKIDLEVIKYTITGLLLNSVLFMGEIFQIIKGMVRVGYKLDILFFKNCVVAPLFEEFIYRVCLINIFLES
jgi:membrane protease YdiL (CAAX protease family)